MLRSIAPNAFSPKQRKKLASPNTPPKIAPAAGPKVTAPTATGTTISVILDCQHFFRQIFLGYFSDIVQAFDTLRKNVCGDDYTSLHNPIVLSSVLPAYGMFHSIQILFL